MPESSEKSMLGTEVKKIRRKENIADWALEIGMALFFTGLIVFPQLLVCGSIIFGSGVIATAIKNVK